jgi:hypothetical protein
MVPSVEYLYAVIVPPPSLTGALNATDICPSLAVATRLVGAPGTSHAVAVTDPYDVLDPAALTALM